MSAAVSTHSLRKEFPLGWGRGRVLAVGGEDPGPEAEAGVVAELDGGEAEVGGLPEELVSLLHPVGVPAGGEGEGVHGCHFPREEGEGRCKSGKRKAEGEKRKAEKSWLGV